nr:hypothetical protein CFP56_16919 [Quercus suber]
MFPFPRRASEACDWAFRSLKQDLGPTLQHHPPSLIEPRGPSGSLGRPVREFSLDSSRFMLRRGSAT